MIFGMLFLNITLVLANENHQSEIEKGKKLTESEISCDKLIDEQLEAIGDYYMEQMHPGKSHELMHDMMGGHDSELTKEMHINMAKGIYCDEDVDMMSGMMGSGMMDMMNRRNIMTGDDIIDMKNIEDSYGSYNSGFVVISLVIYILLIILIVSAIYWLIKSANRKR